MNRLLLALCCCFAVEAWAIVLTPDQTPVGMQKETKKLAGSKASSSQASARKPLDKKQGAQMVKPQVVLSPPSKVSLGFYQASLKANYDMMELYLQQGADINCQNCGDSQQMTALFHEIGRSYDFNYDFNSQLADWLIQHGADINIPASLYLASPLGQSTGVTAVMYIAGKSDIPNLSVLEYLGARGADFKATDSSGRNALHYIQRWDLIGRPNDYAKVSDKMVAFVDQLVQHGTEVNRQDKSGITPLMSAANSCSPAAIKLLLSYGSDTALKNKLDKSALDMAIDQATQSSQGSGCNDVVKILNAPKQGVQSSSSSGEQAVAIYAGTYAGTFSGLDTGTFKATILSNGVMTLHGYSSRGNEFTGEGKVNGDGTVAVGSANTGATFVGGISQDEIWGSWKNTTYNLAGSFQGKKNRLPQ